MNAKTLCKEFATLGVPAAPVVVFDERTALDLIARAERAGLAVSGIDMVHPSDLGDAVALDQRILRDPERLSSWSEARSFVEMLAGRGLYFLVTIESPWSTRLARLRSMARMLVRDNTSSPGPA